MNIPFSRDLRSGPLEKLDSLLSWLFQGILSVILISRRGGCVTAIICGNMLVRGDTVKEADIFCSSQEINRMLQYLTFLCLACFWYV